MIATTRRGFLAAAAPLLRAQSRRRPNILLIMSDDQGYGDLSLHGNPHLRTPHLDSIATGGVRFTQFQVSPVCSPTRASLLTGRYNYRTGVVDTYLGRSMMHPGETTIAEMLGGAGYRTGIFGKWHLGDNYPLRAVDQGFHESLIHFGGGLAQPADPPGSHGYTDPILSRNGKLDRVRGYCTDIFANAASAFVEANRARPFFCYLAANAPHDPLEIGDRYAAPFRGAGLDDTTSKTYGMIRNLDENIGRVLAKLRAVNLERDTIVIFLTDNGPQRDRYNAGMRGRKGTVYQGGIRVPFFVRWPAAIAPGRSVDRIAAHIDLTPTLLDACGIPRPADVQFDGRSLLPLWRGDKAAWPGRTLFTQWHRGDVPQLFRQCAARTQRYKLIDGKELYDLESDPAESTDIAAKMPDVAAAMRRDTERWFADVSSSRGYAPPRIVVGSPHENPSRLSRQDWRSATADWTSATADGYWEIDVAAAGEYEVAARFPKPIPGTTVTVTCGSARAEATAGPAELVPMRMRLEKGPARIHATRNPWSVDVTRI